MTPLVITPEGFKIVPVELSDERAEMIANNEIDASIKLLDRKRSDYTPSQIQDWINLRMREAKKRYSDALAFLD
jgi:hypothetical protein